MNRSIRWGTAGLCLTFLLPVAVAEAPLDSAMLVGANRIAAYEDSALYPKPELSAEASFTDLLQAAKDHPNAYIGEQWLTELLEDDALTEQQHAQTLYARAQHRWKKSSNKIGAFEDFTSFTELYPEDRYANNAGIEAGYVNDQIVHIEARMENLQTLSQWFEDAWQLGQRDYAAARFKRSGLAPEPEEIARFRQAGYICDFEEGEVPEGYGRVTSETPNLYWCG